MTDAGRSRLKLAGAIVLGVAVVASVALPQTRELLERFFDYARELGPWRAAPLVGALYVPACVLFLPGSLVTLGAGAVCGVVAGTVAVSLGSTLGATVAFLLGRTLARDWIAARVAKRPRFQAVDAAVAKKGFQIVLLLRLSPVFPFSFLNYALGITNVRLRDYVLASWLGMLPGTVLYVYLGSALGSLAEAFSGGRRKTPQEWALLAAGLVATIAVSVVVARVARKAIAGSVPEAGGEPAPRSAPEPTVEPPPKGT